MKKKIISAVLVVIAVFSFCSCGTVESISFNEDTVTVDANRTYTPEFTVTPEYAGKSGLTWESSDEYVATVSEDGIVSTLDKSGSCTITVKSENGITASFKLNVKTEADYAYEEMCAKIDSKDDSSALKIYTDKLTDSKYFWNYYSGIYRDDLDNYGKYAAALFLYNEGNLSTAYLLFSQVKDLGNAQDNMAKIDSEWSFLKTTRTGGSLGSSTMSFKDGIVIFSPHYSDGVFYYEVVKSQYTTGETFYALCECYENPLDYTSYDGDQSIWKGARYSLHLYDDYSLLVIATENESVKLFNGIYE